ncbi:MAG: sodium/proline symporter [Gemmatimonadetes bacterium]|nr:sodium/proline symporter [Gemmatimonadota bacterium]
MRELVGLAYFAICAAIAVWASRRTRTADDFFVAGRGVGLVPFAIAAMASTLSGFAFIGGTGLVYSIGMTALFLILPAGVTNTLGAWVLGKRMHRLGSARRLLTVPDALAARYRSPAAQGLSAIAILAGVIGYLATNALALGVVIDALFGTGLGPGIWIGTAVTLAYSVSGGILAGIYTDVFQGLVMAIASTAVFFVALEAGGGLPAITRTIEAADPALLGPWGARGAMTALSFFFVFAVGSLGQPQIAHKYYMLRDLPRLKWYPALMTVAMVLAQLLLFSVGVSVKALVLRGEMPALASPDAATPQFLLRFVPVVLSALVFAGVAAAIMSTVNSFLSIGAAALTHDVPRALGRQPVRQLRIGRVWTIVIAVLAALLAQQAGLLVAFLGILGYGLFASTLVPALAIGLNWTGATREGALASIATGLVMTVGLEWLVWSTRLTVPQGITVTGITLVSSLLVFLGVSWLTRARAAEQLDPDVRGILEDT